MVVRRVEISLNLRGVRRPALPGYDRRMGRR
jgi:hypothetical protein